MRDKNRVKVWDPLVRLFHWGLVLSFVVAYLSAEEAIELHVWAGYAALGLVVFRLFWGIVGPGHARFTDFVRGPRTVFVYLRSALGLRAERHLGHNPAGGAMVMALLLVLALTGLSGLLLLGAGEFSGPLAGYAWSLGAEGARVLEAIHGFFTELTLVLVLLHLAGIVLASLQHRENLVWAMFTGHKPRQTP